MPTFTVEISSLKKSPRPLWAGAFPVGQLACCVAADGTGVFEAELPPLPISKHPYSAYLVSYNFPNADRKMVWSVAVGSDLEHKLGSYAWSTVVGFPEPIGARATKEIRAANTPAAAIPRPFPSELPGANRIALRCATVGPAGATPVDPGPGWSLIVCLTTWPVPPGKNAASLPAASDSGGQSRATIGPKAK